MLEVTVFDDTSLNYSLKFWNLDIVRLAQDWEPFVTSENKNVYAFRQ